MKKSIFLAASLIIWLNFSLNLSAQQSDYDMSIKSDDISDFRSTYSSANLETNKNDLLTKAAAHGAVKILDFLLSQEIDPNVFDSNGKTALIQASGSNQPRAVQLILKRGADVNLKERDGLQGTALMYASSRNMVDVPNLLIAAGANVNTVDINNDPAINWATYYGNIQVMDLLVKNGADLNISSKHGKSVDVGLRLWHADSVLKVFKKSTLGSRIERSTEELINEIQSADLQGLQRKLRRGVNPNLTDEIGTPLLQLAAQEGHLKIVKALIEAGAELNKFNRVGQTALAYAARFGHVNVVEALIEAGADVNAFGSHYQLSALIGSAINGDLELGEKLMAAGAVINQKDSVNQCAPLHWAMMYGNEPFARLILEKGADAHAPVFAGDYTGYSLAKVMGMNDLIRDIEIESYRSNPLSGAWKIEEIHYIYRDTTYKIEEVRQGRLMITDSNYNILYSPIRTDRKPFANLSKPTQEEMVYAFQTLIFNSGTFQMTDSTFTTTSDIARVPGFEGGKQVYRYQVDGRELRLTMFDETYPDGGKPEWYQKLEVLFILGRE